VDFSTLPFFTYRQPTDSRGVVCLTYESSVADSRHWVNVDAILKALSEEQVDYLLIGGMNFLLQHYPELTFDVDIWVEGGIENLGRLNAALKKLGAQWGATEAEWSEVPEDPSWLLRQGVYCLTTRHGALDVFREVAGLEGAYVACKARSIASKTAGGITFQGLADEDMLACQMALPSNQQKTRRIQILREALGKSHGPGE
jgi:hypothetical protein